MDNPRKSDSVFPTKKVSAFPFPRLSKNVLVVDLLISASLNESISIWYMVNSIMNHLQ